ncbi:MULTISPECIES: cadmium resistance transporter [unclassified Ruegeria]|uniref:cadmium resistance transporter n=1 Tax=unclassified Ruegeria TaxID=2625375 RepID=UPI0014882BB6|nr:MULTISPECIES: cadmium resistance transporter [unclassified Ruegeria]
MLELTLFALSAGIALVTTNLDNLAVLLGLFLVVDRRRAIAGFALAQTIMLSLSMIVAVGLNKNGIPVWIGYLGLVPLVLGLRGIWHQASSAEVEEMGAKSAVTSIVTLFLSLSIDSFAVMTPLLADSTPGFRWAALIGASIAAAGLVLLASWGAPHAQNLAPRFARMDRIAPYVMVCVGLYILINSPTDGL